mmetsp:Transcript_61987/g.103032  ORF Transcript_61987/g.103032 Transcript_61987/m.103032 type:complete len:382 (+) Transcript_61987:1-1146(+)|eukprot:CAMPEP_0119314710 /NCGR_PEP_ID=MMETSP1333-20130426/33750_1 /TAXON_ID=418940 /ORGANISM="Scyphosphaera apsteinii, Strain RCC1455" /LENGTH=381 /DNA_ID=CAMNT_0007319883 /DNA_START=166 /DNA_END=1311 /DNA_ORIENTATION=+
MYSCSGQAPASGNACCITRQGTFSQQETFSGFGTEDELLKYAPEPKAFNDDVPAVAVAVEAPASRAPVEKLNRLPDAVCFILVVSIIVLHVGRFGECGSSAAASTIKQVVPSTGWDWMCVNDPFAAHAFAPLHALALLSLGGRLLLSLRGCLRTTHVVATASSFRMLEVFLASYALCWFSSPNAAESIGCRDSDAMCTSWQKAGECEKNAGFMTKSCPLACGFCQGSGSVSSSNSTLRIVTLLAETFGVSQENISITLPVLPPPRLVTLVVAGLLLTTASCRLLFPNSLHVQAATSRSLAVFFLPFTKILLLVIRVFRLAISCFTRTADYLRRALILALGGKVEQAVPPLPSLVEAQAEEGCSPPLASVVNLLARDAYKNK